jgi:hypothetical protein
MDGVSSTVVSYGYLKVVHFELNSHILLILSDIFAPLETHNFMDVPMSLADNIEC